MTVLDGFDGWANMLGDTNPGSWGCWVLTMHVASAMDAAMYRDIMTWFGGMDDIDKIDVTNEDQWWEMEMQATPWSSPCNPIVAQDLAEALQMRQMSPYVYIRLCTIEPWQDFSWCDLSRFVLDGLDLSGCNCRKTRFCGAVIWDTRLAGDFWGADFTDAFLQDVNASWEMASFHGAIFRRAELVSVSFAGADLWGSDFVDATFDEVTMQWAKTEGMKITWWAWDEPMYTDYDDLSADERVELLTWRNASYLERNASCSEE